jgi:chromosomal replication initiation ATPase DnaA
MWAARRHTGLTLREIGAALGGVDYAAVSVAVKRLEARAKRDRPLAALQRQVAELLNVEMSPQ